MQCFLDLQFAAFTGLLDSVDVFGQQAFVDADDYVERSYLSSLLDDLGITADTDCVFHTGTAALASSHIKSRELFGSCRVYDRARFGCML